MHRTSTFFSTLLLTAAAFGQPTSPDSLMTQNLLGEIRQLRRDLQATAATIQRVQIVMYRVQTGASLLNRVTERLESARYRCNEAQAQRKMTSTQIQDAETRKRNSQDPSEQKAFEEQLRYLKLTIERLASEEPQCQVELVEAETQFRAEQIKMNDLHEQLDRLDKVLASQGSQ